MNQETNSLIVEGTTNPLINQEKSTLIMKKKKNIYNNVQKGETWEHISKFVMPKDTKQEQYK